MKPMKFMRPFTEENVTFIEEFAQKVIDSYDSGKVLQFPPRHPMRRMLEGLYEESLHLQALIKQWREAKADLEEHKAGEAVIRDIRTSFSEGSFTDANGRTVKPGDRVQYSNGRDGVMIAIFQDGSGYIHFDGDVGDTDINWKHAAKHPPGYKGA